MKRIQLTSGDVYLTGYENTDIIGNVLDDLQKNMIADGIVENINETTLDNYYKFPFEPDFNKRIRRDFIIDRLMDIKKIWPWEDKSVDEIVQISSFEHFQHRTEVPHIINEAYRVLKVGGIYKFDFPDVVEIVKKYSNKNNDDYLMELVYGNHKAGGLSEHEYGYTWKSIQLYFDLNKWSLIKKATVEKDYPSIGVWATKIK